MYPILLVPLALMLFKRLRHLYLFLYIWGVFTILATLKGLVQLYIGLDPGEQFWIDTVGGITHLINGQLRVFPFLVMLDNLEQHKLLQEQSAYW